MSRDREDELRDLVRRIRALDADPAARVPPGRIGVVFERPLPYVYLAREERGSGLVERLRAHELAADSGAAPAEPPAREFGTAAEILADLGVGSVRLLTNDPLELPGLQEHGIAVSGQEPVMGPVDERNREYLRTKAQQLGHLYRAYDLGFMSVEDDGFEPRLARHGR